MPDFEKNNDKAHVALPTINGVAVFGSQEIIEKQISWLSDSVYRFRTKYSSKLNDSSGQRTLIEALTHFFDIRKAQFLLLHVADFWQLKDPSNKLDLIQRIYDSVDESTNNTTFFVHYIIKNPKKIEALKGNSALAKYKPMLDYYTQPILHQPLGLSPEKIASIHAQMDRNLLTPGLGSVEYAQIKKLTEFIKDAASHGMENPDDYGAFRNSLSQEELSALKKAIEENKDILKEYIWRQKLAPTQIQQQKASLSQLTNALGFETIIDLTIKTQYALAKELGKEATQVYEKGLIELHRENKNFIVMSSLEPTSVMVGKINGSLNNGKDLSSLMGNITPFLHQSRQGILRPFESLGLELITGHLSERMFWVELRKAIVDSIENGRSLGFLDQIISVEGNGSPSHGSLDETDFALLSRLDASKLSMPKLFAGQRSTSGDAIAGNSAQKVSTSKISGDFVRSVTKRHRIALDLDAMMLDGVVESLMRFLVVDTFNRSAAEILLNKDTFDPKTLNTSWEKVQKEYYPQEILTQPTSWTKEPYVGIHAFFTLPILYAQLVSERMWQEWETNPNDFSKKIMTVVKDSYTKPPKEILTKAFGFDTESPEFWTEAFGPIRKAVEKMRTKENPALKLHR